MKTALLVLVHGSPRPIANQEMLGGYFTSVQVGTSDSRK